MKLSKKLLVTAALLTAAVVSFAQTTGYTGPASSLLSDKTAGLFENEFDKQFTVNPDFGTYGQQFLYGGLGNPRKERLNAVPAIRNVMFGYYRPSEERPWSVFGDWGAEGTFARAGSTKQTVGGATITTTPLGLFFFQKYTTNLQFLTKVGGANNIVVGGQFFLYSDFSNLTPDHFMKTQAKGGAAPGVTEQWNFNSASVTNATLVLPESEHNFEIGVPVAFKTGEIEHGARVFLNSHITERNGSYKTTVGSKKERKITDMGAYTKLGASYLVSLPVQDSSEDRWLLGGDFNFGIAGQSYEQKVTGIAVLDNVKSTYKLATGGGIAVEGGRLFNFHPAESIVFKIRPEVRLGYNGALNTEFDANGNIKDPEAWLQKRVGGPSPEDNAVPKQWKSAHQLLSSVSVPMGITIKPDKWICGFVLGVTPAALFRTNILYAEQASKTGARTIEVREPVFSETHVVGLTFEFAGGVRLDVELNGQLTDIRNFTAQVFIPLGVPKGKGAPAKAPAAAGAKSGAAKKN